jgi:hypothetical protein
MEVGMMGMSTKPNWKMRCCDDGRGTMTNYEKSSPMVQYQGLAKQRKAIYACTQAGKHWGIGDTSTYLYIL